MEQPEAYQIQSLDILANIHNVRDPQGRLLNAASRLLISSIFHKNQQDFVAPMYQVEDSVRSLSDAHAVYVITTTDAPIQLVAAAIVERTDSQTTEVFQLAVAEDFRRKKFGSALMRYIAKVAGKQRHTTITLQAMEPDFYAALGFHEGGSQNDDDSLTMIASPRMVVSRTKSIPTERNYISDPPL